MFSKNVFTKNELKYLHSRGRFHPETGEPAGLTVEQERRLVAITIATTREFDRAFPGKWYLSDWWPTEGIRVEVIGHLYTDQARHFRLHIHSPEEAKNSVQAVKAAMDVAKAQWVSFMASCRAAKRRKAA